MFLLSQIGLSLLLAGLIGGLVGGAWRGRRLEAKRADFQETMQAAESRHSEQLAFFSADHEHSLAALEQARRDIAHSLEQTRTEATSVQVKLAQRDQQLQELSGVLLKANQDLAKAETARRTVLQERQRAREEVDVLRKQVVTTRAELAQMLGLNESERAQLIGQLTAAREERDLLLERMQQMVSLLQKAQFELEQRTAHLGTSKPAVAVSPDAQETVLVPMDAAMDAPRRVA